MSTKVKLVLGGTSVGPAIPPGIFVFFPNVPQMGAVLKTRVAELPTAWLNYLSRTCPEMTRAKLSTLFNDLTNPTSLIVTGLAHYELVGSPLEALAVVRVDLAIFFPNVNPSQPGLISQASLNRWG